MEQFPREMKKLKEKIKNLKIRRKKIFKNKNSYKKCVKFQENETIFYTNGKIQRKF